MKRFWFRVRIDRKAGKVVKVLIQAPDHDTATKILKEVVKDYYPGYPDFDILNKRDILTEEYCYVVIGDSETTHYTTYLIER